MNEHLHTNDNADVSKDNAVVVACGYCKDCVFYNSTIDVRAYGVCNKPMVGFDYFSFSGSKDNLNIVILDRNGVLYQYDFIVNECFGCINFLKR